MRISDQKGEFFLADRHAPCKGRDFDNPLPRGVKRNTSSKDRVSLRLKSITSENA